MAYTPSNKNSILASIPEYFTQLPYDIHETDLGIDLSLLIVRAAYGPNIYPFTIDMAKKFKGKEIYILQGQGYEAELFFEYGDKPIRISKIDRFNLLEKMKVKNIRYDEDYNSIVVNFSDNSICYEHEDSTATGLECSTVFILLEFI